MREALGRIEETIRTESSIQQRTASLNEEIDLANTAPDIQVYSHFGVAVTLAYPVVLLAAKAGNFDVSESTFGLRIDADVMRKTYRGLSRPTAHAHVIAVFGHTP